MKRALLNDVSRHRTRRAGEPTLLAALLVSAGLLGALSLACGDAAQGASVLTIAECQELGGSPFFDPEDERPIEMSCPEGLGYLGEFDEPFFGAHGGLCCAGFEVSETPAVAR
jgi:hypothetical protein